MIKVIANGVEKHLLKKGVIVFTSENDLSFSLSEPFVSFYRDDINGVNIEPFTQQYCHFDGTPLTVKANYAISDGVNCSICLGDPLNPKDSDIITDINGYKFTFASVDYVKYAGGAFEMDVVGIKGSPKTNRESIYNLKPKELNPKNIEEFKKDLMIFVDEYFKK